LRLLMLLGSGAGWAGRDAADLVPVEDSPSWTTGSRARELIAAAQADAGLASELDRAFPDTTDQL
jgi:hypothetical protein